jgi:hypothetical protein
MEQLSKLNLEGFNPEMSFQITLDNYEDKNNNENPSIDLISNDLQARLKKDITESVMNLTQCFICLSIADYPLSCPKCNNFACKECLEKYFGEENEKKCPLCNQLIKKNDLKKNKTIREIEKIIYKEDTKNNKIKELSKIVNEKKKKLWENQEQYLNNLINNVIQYQENMRQYRKKYELYIIKWKQQIDKVFSQYEKKIENLIDLLLKYKQKYGKDLSESIKSKEKKSINSLVNEIVILDRNFFNEENKKQEINYKYKANGLLEDIIKKSNEFFITPILIMPNISNYNIEILYIDQKEFKKGNINKKDYNVHIGNYKLQHIFDTKNYLVKCKLLINNERDVSFFPIQKKILDEKFYEIIPMKDISGLIDYNYEAEFDINELKNNSKITIRIETKVQIFSVIG